MMIVKNQLYKNINIETEDQLLQITDRVDSLCSNTHDPTNNLKSLHQIESSDIIIEKQNSTKKEYSKHCNSCQQYFKTYTEQRQFCYKCLSTAPAARKCTHCNKPFYPEKEPHSSCRFCKMSSLEKTKHHLASLNNQE